MSCKCAPALNQLLDQLNTLFPDRDKSSDGCCGDADHRTRKSDHNPTNGYAHARDVDEDIRTQLGTRPLYGWVEHLLKDSRTKYVIYERRIWYARCQVHGSLCFTAGGHTYNGINAHDKHLHISIWTTSTFDIRDWVMPSVDGPIPSPDPQLPSTKEEELLTYFEVRLGNRVDAFYIGAEDFPGKDYGHVWHKFSTNGGWDWELIEGEKAEIVGEGQFRGFPPTDSVGPQFPNRFAFRVFARNNELWQITWDDAAQDWNEFFLGDKVKETV